MGNLIDKAIVSKAKGHADVRPGERYQDNDPRGPRRTVEVVEVDTAGGFAIVQGARRTRVSLRNFYRDGKPRTRGFSLIAARDPSASSANTNEG